MLRINLDEENKYRVREVPSDFADDNSIKGKIEKKAKRAEVKKKEESSREKRLEKSRKLYNVKIVELLKKMCCTLL